MESRSRFLHRTHTATERGGDAAGPARATNWTACVRPRRSLGAANPSQHTTEAGAEGRRQRRPEGALPVPPRKAPSDGVGASVPQTDAGGLVGLYPGERENLRQGTRQHDPVTSGEGDPRPVPSASRWDAGGGRSELAQPTVYQKHRSLRT